MGECKMKYFLTVMGFLLMGPWAQAQLVNEVIVDPSVTGRDWTAEIVNMHEVWMKPACSAYTMSEDGDSSLEVIAYYDKATNTFSEPEVNVVTMANISFLDVIVTTSGAKTQYQMLPVQPANQDMVGARVLFDDRENLTDAIRRHNFLIARYLDAAGEVKSIRFSLRGSSNAVRATFDRCSLQFRDELVLPDPM